MNLTTWTLATGMLRTCSSDSMVTLLWHIAFQGSRLELRNEPSIFTLIPGLKWLRHYNFRQALLVSDLLSEPAQLLVLLDCTD